MPASRKMSASKNGRHGRRYTNSDHSDRELLANIKDVADHDGWATTTAIGRACGFTGSAEKGDTPARKIASRLGWMRSMGLLESAEPDRTQPYLEPGDHDTVWRATPVGAAIRDGKLKKSVTTALASMGEGDRVVLLREIAQQTWVNGDPAVAAAARREWQYNLAQRKLVFRAPRG